jgi:hypothetical protein
LVLTWVDGRDASTVSMCSSPAPPTAATNGYGAAVWNDVRRVDCPTIDAWRMSLRTGDSVPTPAPQQNRLATFLRSTEEHQEPPMAPSPSAANGSRGMVS